jgi:sporulation protein YlmC with PRC-barrel domain
LEDKKLKGGFVMFRRAAVFVLSIFGVMVFFNPSSSLAQGKRDLVLASRIIDGTVLTVQGKETGEVDDLIIRRSGKVKKITMEIGGFLIFGEKLVSVKPGKVQIKDEKVVVNLTEEQLENKVEFNYYESGLRPGYYYRTRPYYYAPRPYYAPYRPYPQTRSEQGEEWAHSPGRFLASVIMDRLLVNHEGISIGRLEDLLIDKDEYRVEKILLSSEEIRGEDSYVEIPYEPLGFGPYGLIYDISVEKLKNLPEYPYED